MEPASNPRVLLVEGSDDKHVIKHLLQSRSLQKRFKIAPKGGFENLRRSIYNEVNVSGRSVLGILADANDNPAGLWQSISNQLDRAGCQIPPNWRNLSTT